MKRLQSMQYFGRGDRLPELDVASWRAVRTLRKEFQEAPRAVSLCGTVRHLAFDNNYYTCVTISAAALVPAFASQSTTSMFVVREWWPESAACHLQIAILRHIPIQPCRTRSPTASLTWQPHGLNGRVSAPSLPHHPHEERGVPVFHRNYVTLLDGWTQQLT